MIKSFSLKNFQSHKNTSITLDPGVNVIIGDSDSGKSSIIRAMLWLIRNRPTGDDFRSTWGGSTHVTMVTDQDNIVRMRNDTENGYRLNTQTHFKAIKTDVPEEIQKALNLSDVNLQGQLDGHFLLTSTPGEVAAHFNKVAKLFKIDVGLKNINSWILDTNKNIKWSENSLAKHEEELTTYKYLEEFEAEVEVLEELESRLNKATRHKKELDQLISELEQVEDDIAYEQEILKDEELITSTLDLIYKRDALEDGPLAELTELIDEIEITEYDLIAEETSLLELEKRFEKEFPDVCPLCDKPK